MQFSRYGLRNRDVRKEYKMTTYTPKLGLELTTSAEGSTVDFLPWRLAQNNTGTSNMILIDDFAVEVSGSITNLNNRIAITGTNSDLLMITNGSPVTSGSNLSEIAPAGAPFVVLSARGDLTNESVLYASGGITLTKTSGKVSVDGNIIAGSGIVMKTTTSTSALQISSNLVAGSGISFDVNSGSAVTIHGSNNWGVTLTTGNGITAIQDNAFVTNRVPYSLHLVNYNLLLDAAGYTTVVVLQTSSDGVSWSTISTITSTTTQSKSGTITNAITAGYFIKMIVTSGGGAKIASLSLNLTKD